ncbi:uncharacterized protein M6B38_256810 [Iris pallida]|uniref:Uncharacterized protein n=1 Tax=Iris pallida TaxID=29817 RepID=A0AAX6F9V7_IRIPA|nr:uncharacterized protein M6B38_145390 [Iris pallida]KAJ6852164.1 uncharacterized protein M6B38_256810 [Iris pallida]
MKIKCRFLCKINSTVSMSAIVSSCDKLLLARLNLMYTHFIILKCYATSQKVELCS